MEYNQADIIYTLGTEAKTKTVERLIAPLIHLVIFFSIKLKGFDCYFLGYFASFYLLSTRPNKAKRKWGSCLLTAIVGSFCQRRNEYSSTTSGGCWQNFGATEFGAGRCAKYWSVGVFKTEMMDFYVCI